MFNLFHKPYSWASFFSVVLALSIVLVMLDTFVIPQAGTPVYATSTKATTTAATGDSSQTTESQDSSTTDAADITDNSYEDENIKITIETIRAYDTDIYIADIQISSIEYLQSAFAQGTYGRNIKEATSSMAESNNAIFAINGDYYGFRNSGFVLRDGILYRDSSAGDTEDLVIDNQGNFSIINENQTEAQSLVDAGIWQLLSFGPTLINSNQITVDENSEVSGKSMVSNPRTAIGQISALHYIAVVSDGRTSQSAGLSLLELAQVMSDRGCTTAYNLDGGGSSTMWFNGQIINNPTTNGNKVSERSVSDIVYIGY